MRGQSPDEVNGCVVVDAAGPPGVLRTISFTKGQTDEGLDVLTPILVEGELVIRRYPAPGQFPAAVEVQVRKARRVWRGERLAVAALRQPTGM